MTTNTALPKIAIAITLLNSLPFKTIFCKKSVVVQNIKRMVKALAKTHIKFNGQCQFELASVANMEKKAPNI